VKIIATTVNGYIVEIAPSEIAAITGNQDHDRHDSSYSQRGHPIGSEFTVSKTWKHLNNLLSNEKERKQIAESLRAAATLIEHTPSPLTLPAVEAPAAE